MPELPDIVVYIDALETRIHGQPLEGLRLRSPFLLHTVRPKPQDAVRHRVIGLRRIGKRIAIGFDNDIWFVLHLMIVGRLHWKDRGAKIGAKTDLAAFDFPDGSLILTEAGNKKRAALHVVAGDEALNELDPGGIEVLDCTFDAFRQALTETNHTVKRALTDPRIFCGIGNAYSDEILHRARMSPILQTQKMSDDDIRALLSATQDTLNDWTDRLRRETGDGFPKKVTAFRVEMSVHGRYKEPCPDCGNPVQRIRYADNETNYCAACQTGGKLLADRSLSRLLKKDWPRSLEELEEMSLKPG
ncbi:MAG: Fpg/Nei family DNA glycosylase [Alphaproteobacteria bacterium]